MCECEHGQTLACLNVCLFAQISIIKSKMCFCARIERSRGPTEHRFNSIYTLRILWPSEKFGCSSYFSHASYVFIHHPFPSKWMHKLCVYLSWIIELRVDERFHLWTLFVRLCQLHRRHHKKIWWKLAVIYFQMRRWQWQWQCGRWRVMSSLNKTPC